MSKKRRRHVSTRSFPDSQPQNRTDSTRDATSIAARAAKLARVLSLTDIEDRRRYYHDPRRPADPIPAARSQRTRSPHRLVSGAVARHSVQPVGKVPILHDSGFLQFVPGAMRDVFDKPRQTLVCIRRRARRAVLFALQKIGHGAGGRRFRRARWSESSYIRCRR